MTMSKGQGTGTDPELPTDLSSDINTNVAHSARVYDYWLGGKDNFPADRELAELMIQAIPDMRAMAAANRAFLSRAVRYLVGEAGVRQFLDLGTGIPTSPNVHEIAQAAAPDTRVVYVDNDPIVLAHARALLTTQDAGETAFIMADLRQPGSILDHPTLTATLDLDQPVAVLAVGVLMYFRDSDSPNPFEMVATVLEPMPSGSYLAVTTPTPDFNPEETAKAVAAAEAAGITLVPRGKAEVARFFSGLELVDPGVAPMLAWRPDEQPADPERAYYWAGVARKP
jgi:O-methyltransferase involved in polyketide biosynthesis